MAFNGSEGSTISLAQGETMTEYYRRANPNSIKGVFIGKDLIEDILAQSGCVGIRTYFALDSNDKETIVIVGADATEGDITGGIIVNDGKPCPPSCKQSPLNS